jgi:trk system potassium uptake protein TrkH
MGSAERRFDRRWTEPWQVRRRLRTGLWHRLTPPQLFVGSFLVLVALGTLGLRMLPGLYTGEPLGWLDALFTATSAVCVTGLIVVDTATYFTAAGQAFILLLIQLGGLGIITFTTLIILTLGRRLSLRHEALAGPDIHIGDEVNHRRLAFDIVRFTVLFEAIGTVLLYLLWVPRLGWAGASWPALFHSISAFCNAGFSIFSDSLMRFQQSPLTLLVVSALIVFGGLGFIVLEELYLRRGATRRGGYRALSLHTRLVLVSTMIFLGVGWILFAGFEWSGVLGELGAGHRVTNAFFMSATARTAGFNSIDYAAAHDDTNFLTILLMSIGGSPGSTAGGMKTTTFALIGLLALARLRGQESVSAWGRTVPGETIQRAVGLFVLGFGVITLALFGYAHTELAAPPAGGQPFLRHMFEAVSAFNTVGLSMGVTPGLSGAGRWMTLVLMFVGRVGPLVFASALARRVTRVEQIRYSKEDVVIG